MAKVMISLPDELLTRLDERVRQTGTTRSGFLRDLASRELRSESVARRDRMNRLLAASSSHGGEAWRHVRAQRRAR